MSYKPQESYVPSEAELQKLLGAIKLKSTWGKRDYLMIVFLCHTGLRIGEACSLTTRLVSFQGEPRDDLHLSYCIVKGHKSRNVPLNSVAQKCVAKLLAFNQKRGFSVEPWAPLFPWKKHGFLPIREFERTIQKLREKVGLPDKLTPHKFRHFFATRLLETGTDNRTLQALLGHEKMSSTQRYTHTTEERKRAAVMRFCDRGAA